MTALAAAFTRDVTDGWRTITDEELQKMRALLLSMDEESQDTLLLKKERNSFDAVEELARMRISVNQRLQECRIKKQAFEKKQGELRKNALDNEEFIRDNDKKIETCEKKAREEMAECKRLDEELMQIEAKVQELQLQKEMDAKAIERGAHYKRLFEQTAQVYENEFEGDVENLMKRENALRRTTIELQENNQQLQHRLEDMREAWMAEQLRLQNEELVVNTSVHQCQMNLESSRVEMREMENKLKSAQEEKEWKESTVGIMKLAIDQLLQRTLASCRLPQRKKAMLDFVDAPKGQGERYHTDLMLMAMSERLKELLWLREKASEFENENGNVQETIMTTISPQEIEFHG
eukprot:GEMP01036172.1.p1 GENE.GEMP01036172.1~~GEMP01036172.1.p1  ORF type:complete len:357 (+),score=125.16 GEMP01036172.1:23-1072(+)